MLDANKEKLGKLAGHPAINLTMLRALAVLGETLSFSRTADRLCITQSAVSHAIRALEGAAGTVLVNRVGRAVSLTAAGEKAASLARSALASIQEIATLSQVSLEGEVTLALITSASIKLAPPLLELVASRYPGLQISLLVGTDQEVADWVREGVADLGISFDAGDCEKQQLLVSEYLFIEGAKSSTRNEAPTLPAVAEKAFIMSAGGCAPIIKHLFDEASVSPNIALTVNDTTALFTLVAAGRGVSIVPALAFPPAGDYDVRRSSLHPEVRRPLWLVNRRGAQARADMTALKAMIAEVVERLISERRFFNVSLE